MMVDRSYDADFSTAVITSSCEGLLVPPSHNMVIYATTAGVSSVGSPLPRRLPARRSAQPSS